MKMKIYFMVYKKELIFDKAFDAFFMFVKTSDFLRRCKAVQICLMAVIVCIVSVASDGFAQGPGNNLDNYGRLSCYLYLQKGGTKIPGLEALFIDRNAGDKIVRGKPVLPLHRGMRP